MATAGASVGGGAIMAAMRFGMVRLHYLLLFALIGAVLPYAPVDFKQRGLSDWQVGWVMGAYGLAVLVMPAVIGHFADRRWSNRRLLGAGYAGAALMLAALAMVERFEAVLLLFVLFAMSYTPMLSLTDGLTFGAMHTAEERGAARPTYTRLRIWGSVGFMLPALLMFALVTLVGATARSGLIVAATVGAIAALTAPLLPRTGGRSAARDASAPINAAPTAEAWRALSRGPLGVAIAALFLMFLAISIFYIFFSRYLEELGVPIEWIGPIHNIGVVVEIFFIIAARRVFEAVGIKGVLVAGALCMTARFALLATMPGVATAIATQVLHGPIVMSLYILPPMYLNQKADRSYRTSMQGLYGAMCYGVARVIGGAVGGQLTALGQTPLSGICLALTFSTALAAIASTLLILRFSDATSCARLRGELGRPTVAAAPEP